MNINNLKSDSKLQIRFALFQRRYVISNLQLILFFVALFVFKIYFTALDLCVPWKKQSELENPLDVIRQCLFPIQRVQGAGCSFGVPERRCGVEGSAGFIPICSALQGLGPCCQQELTFK